MEYQIGNNFKGAYETRANDNYSSSQYDEEEKRRKNSCYSSNCNNWCC